VVGGLRRRRAVADPWILLAVAALLFLIVFVALPLAELVKQAFIAQRSGALGFENFATFFGSGFFRRALSSYPRCRRCAAWCFSPCRPSTNTPVPRRSWALPRPTL
jgi:hypothetical protein